MSLLRQALAKPVLEDYEASPNPNEEAAILMKGPLADIYTRALNVAYAKKPLGEEEGEEPAPPLEAEEFVGSASTAARNTPTWEQAALESVQIDKVLLEHMAKLIKPEGEIAAGQPVQTVFAVSKADVKPQTVIDVSRAVDKKSDDNGAYSRDPWFFLIIDATVPGPNSQAVGNPEYTVLANKDAVAAEDLDLKSGLQDSLCLTLEAIVQSVGGKTYASLEEYVRDRLQPKSA